MFEDLPKKRGSKNSNSDKVLTRLILILQKLSNNEYPTRKYLTEEFNVSAKTIQRDINERLIYFPIEENKVKQLYFIEGFSLNKTTLQNEEMLFIYLALSQIKDINKDFEKTTHHIFSKLLSPRFDSAYHIKPNTFESIDINSKILKDIERAIKYQNKVFLSLSNRDFVIEPYKVVSFDGIWYLFGKDTEDGKIKTVFLHQIKSMDISKGKFVLDKPVDLILSNVHTAWFEDGNSLDVVIKVNSKIAYNFKLKRVLPSQEILEEFEDGSLLIKFSVTTEEDVDNMIKAWIPDIELISPENYRENFVEELKKYINLYEGKS